MGTLSGVQEDLVTPTQLHIHRGDKRQQNHNERSDLKKRSAMCNYNINLSCFVGGKVLLTCMMEIGSEFYRPLSHAS